MALEYYDNRNKRTDVPLHFEYSMEQMSSASGDYQSNSFWWRIVRRARKTYSYVGLSKAAAKRCADEKKLYYTRPFVFWGEYRGGWYFRIQGIFGSPSWRSLPLGNADRYFECVADINVTRMDGELYTVQITVDETVVMYKRLYGRLHSLPPKDQFERWFADKNFSWAHTYGYEE